MYKIIVFFKTIIPGNIELLLNHANSQSNFALYGIHHNLYYTRNLLYGFSLLSGINFYFHYYYLSYYFFLFGFVNHLHHFYKWHKLLFK